MAANQSSDSLFPSEGFFPVDQGALFYREIGHGQPVIILHGGPDFDHNYLLPDMDRLSNSFRLVYYDQRGRGKSVGVSNPDQVSIQSEIKDLERLREHLKLESFVTLGHSWGGLLGMEYAIRHPNRVSHLLLVNTCPVSHDDFMLFRQELHLKRTPTEIEKMRALSAATRYEEGDLELDAEFNRIHFRPAGYRPEQLERVIKNLRVGMTPGGVRRSRVIEDQLYDETWRSSDYNLLPMLKKLNIPTLVIHGDHDFIPVECAVHIAQAISSSRFVLLKECGHFSYMESPDEFYKEVSNFIQSH